MAESLFGRKRVTSKGCDAWSTGRWGLWPGPQARASGRIGSSSGSLLLDVGCRIWSCWLILLPQLRSIASCRWTWTWSRSWTRSTWPLREWILNHRCWPARSGWRRWGCSLIPSVWQLDSRSLLWCSLYFSVPQRSSKKTNYICRWLRSRRCLKYPTGFR